ncbi:MAG: SoxR reducing system RseC family protein [Candidatus Omnitrophica bacterium]|nr:SoxR reducing system RseC family protein [Candidatus Omnitrophota bacterium]
MREEGIVQEVRGDKACVRIAKKVSCVHCAAPCIRGEKGDTILWADNAAEARPGERVTVFIPDSAILSGAVLCYGFPTLFFIIGFFIAKLVFLLSDLYSFLFALVSFALSLVLLRYISRYLGSYFTPRVESTETIRS